MFDKKEYNKQYRLKNKDKLKDYNKIYYQNNLEKEKRRSNKYRQEHREAILERQKQYRQKNKEARAKYYKQWRQDHKVAKLGYQKQYYQKNKKRELEKGRQYYQSNKDIVSKRNKQYRLTHKKKFNEYIKNKRKTDLKFNLNGRVSGMMRGSLRAKKAGRRWEGLVGYVLADLKKRLNETIPEGYAWQDFIDGRLQMDHIIPISAFNFTKHEHIDFKRCWALSNLRLVTPKENSIKGTKLDRPFQPALAI